MDTLSGSFLTNTEDIDRGIVFLAKDYFVEFSNEKFCEMMGMSRSEVHGLDLREYTCHEDVEDNTAALKAFLEGNTEGYSEVGRMHRKNGAVFRVEKNYNRLYNDKNELIYQVITFKEIPEKLF
jgi:PAS domain S-box-containing protein